MKGLPSFCLRAGVLALALGLSASGGPLTQVRAQDFFSIFVHPPEAPRMIPPFAPPFGYAEEPPPGYSPPMRRHRPASAARTSTAAYCVRTCDGRYFPAPPVPDQSRAEACRSFCPASDTEVFYGSGIDDATSAKGKPYSELPNAFKYRSQLVSGCTCNGRDPVGLAKVDLKDDETLRRGDMVASSDGIMVVNGKSSHSDRRRASINFTPAPSAIQNRFETKRRLAAD
jgi:hypothetical protein